MRLLKAFYIPVQLRTGPRVVIGVLIALVVALVLSRPLQLQLWNDEVFSLRYFQRVPFLQTATDYSESNNVVLFNLIQNAWIRLLGNPANRELLQAPWMLRIPPLLYAITASLVLFFGILRRYGTAIALLGLTVLLTSVAYYNYALQGRAYGLLITMGVLQFFGFLDYLERGGARRLWIQPVWAFMLFYAHPGGLYLGVSWILATAICFSGDLRRSSLMRQRALYSCGAWICGLFLAGLLYLPIADKILHNPWVVMQAPSLAGFFRDTFVSVIRQLIGGQWWLVALLAVAVAATRFLRDAPFERRLLIYCCTIILGAYLMPLLRLDAVAQRTFTMLIPYVAIGTVAAAAGVLKSLPERRWKLTLVPLFTLALAIQAPFELQRRDHRIARSIREGTELFGIENSYYLDRFNPQTIVEKAAAVQRRTGLPVYTAIAYRQEMPHYLEANGMDWNEYRTPAQQAALPDSALIITSMLPEFRRRFGLGLEYTVLDSSGGFYELLRVRRRGNTAP